MQQRSHPLGKVEKSHLLDKVEKSHSLGKVEKSHQLVKDSEPNYTLLLQMGKSKKTSYRQKNIKGWLIFPKKIETKIEDLPLEILDLICKFLFFVQYPFFEPEVIDVRALFRFSKALKQVKRTPTFCQVFKILRSDMLGIVGQSEAKNNIISREYNLSGEITKLSLINFI